MTHIALYRRFRPENFDDVVGQEPLIDTLRGQVMNSRVNHAYLFCGPRGIGKTSVARILAKAINCQNPQNGNFCGECSACIALNNQNNFDIIEIDAASNNGVDNIRDLRENIKFMPAAGKYRVYIVDEVHMLSINAFNALLKTLEEPPAHIVFIMATTEPGKLPITVLSRCQRFDFNRFKASDIIKLLKKVAEEARIKIDSKAIESIARASEGGARDALSLLDQCNAFTEGKITQEHVSTILGSANRLMYFALADSILKQDTARALNGFNKMLNEGCNTLSVARDLMGHFRDLFIAKHVKDIAETLSIDDVMAARFTSQAQNASEGVLIRCIDLFSTLESDLRYAAHPRIFIELAIAKACRSERDDSYESLLERIENLETLIKSGNIILSDNKTEESHKKKDETIASEIKQVPQIVKDAVEEYSDMMPPPEGGDILQTSDYIEPVDEQNEYFPYSDNELLAERDAEKPKEEVEETERATAVSLAEQIAKMTDRNDKTAEKPKKKSGTGSSKDAKALWKKTIDIISHKKKMGVATAMKKGRPQTIENDTLIIVFDENLTALNRLEDKDSIRLINEALNQAADRKIHVKIERKILDDDVVKFREDVSKFPKDLINNKN